MPRRHDITTILARRYRRRGPRASPRVDSERTLGPMPGPTELPTCVDDFLLLDLLPGACEKTEREDRDDLDMLRERFLPTQQREEQRDEQRIRWRIRKQP